LVKQPNHDKGAVTNSFLINYNNQVHNPQTFNVHINSKIFPLYYDHVLSVRSVDKVSNPAVCLWFQGLPWDIVVGNNQLL